MKKVLYTCITGEYDNVPVYKYIAPGWDYVLFTDNEKLLRAKKFAHWIVRPLPFSKLDNVRNSRWPKINAHKVFPDYVYSLYIDANIIVNNNNIFDIADKLIKQNVLFALPNHPERICIYDEAEIIKEYGIDSPDLVDAEMDFLKSEKYPEKMGLSENNILLRKHNEITETLDLWWYMVEKYSKRDQLSLCYALWKTGVNKTPIYTLENGFGCHRSCEDFTFVFGPNHGQNRKKQKSGCIKPRWLYRFINIFSSNHKKRKQI